MHEVLVAHYIYGVINSDVMFCFHYICLKMNFRNDFMSFMFRSKMPYCYFVNPDRISVRSDY